MALQAQLQQDLQDAMRAQDTPRKLALRMVRTQIQLAEVDKKDTLTDAEVVDIIRKEVRRREDALEMVKQAGRDEMAAEDIVQLDILRQYLPQLLNVDEITTLAKAAIAEVGATSTSDIGQVMRVLMPRVKGKADGRLVNQTVRQLLSN